MSSVNHLTGKSNPLFNNHDARNNNSRAIDLRNGYPGRLKKKKYNNAQSGALSWVQNHPYKTLGLIITGALITGSSYFGSNKKT